MTDTNISQEINLNQRNENNYGNGILLFVNLTIMSTKTIIS
jgi:hypothetical protein